MTDAPLFTPQTTSIVYGLQEAAVQRMLDFDYLCRRATPSVACVVNPEGAGVLKAFFGKTELLIPVYASIPQAVAAHPHASVLVNFASFRSAYATTQQALEQPSIALAVVIAEGMPERQARELAALAKKEGKVIIGPATVGGIAPGSFRIGNTGGSNENLLASKLHRPGSVGLVTKSGGLLNELCAICARNADGVREAVAVGGDAYPGSTLLDHALRYQRDSGVAIILLLGELGGTDEYAVADAIKAKKITKPLVALVTGSCAAFFPGEVQFGHAGAKSGAERESADAKNKALAAAGAAVPRDFEDLERALASAYEKLVRAGKIKPVAENQPPELPLDYAVAAAAGKVRRATNILSTISDERGDDVSYAGYPLAELVENGAGVGDVIGLLWFKKKLSPLAARYIERVLVITADHGPAVSGAHNTIVASRAGKDVVSALCSGLLTIGPRFGGAIDDAARCFKTAADAGVGPQAFVDEMKRKGVPIPGIGHRVKSVTNPDKRVQLLQAYARKYFKTSQYLDYALAVEKITTAKKNSLILNVDGTIAATFLDLMASSGDFSEEEIQDALDAGFFNGLFALGRSIGLIGHALDQKRLKQHLYRHPWDDILFQLPERKA